MVLRDLSARPLRTQFLSCWAIGVTLLALTSCGHGDAPPPPSVPEVNVVTAALRPIPLDLKYSARTRGEREVEVHARVSGILLKRYYREGDAVAANATGQVVDGLWSINGEQLQTELPGYDRLVALGSMTWTDYEVEVPVTVHSLNPEEAKRRRDNIPVDEKTRGET